MAEFLPAAAFPHGAVHVVVIGFWLLALMGGVDTDSLDSEVDTDALKLGGVPLSEPT